MTVEADQVPLEVFNTLGRRKEVFQPQHEGFVGIYVCGPTVYDHAHIGHAKSYVSFDAIVRYLRFLGYRVRYVQNITDVGHLSDDADEGEDRIVRRAQRDRLEPMELVENYTRSYFEDMDALGVVRPDISPRASGHVPEQIELVERLLECGYAYEANGSVYFSVDRFPEYGKLSGRRTEQLLEGARLEANRDKRSPLDFALWKRAEPGHILRWRSPWSLGFPGWHLECSAMATKYLGQPFDIHGGGLDNQFPHHESEIAQSEAAYGVPLCRYWLHNNMVTVGGRKMGKSLGNAIFLKELFDRYQPLTVRYFILNSHYRPPLDFTDEALEAAERGLRRLHDSVRRLRAAAEESGARSQESGVRRQETGDRRRETGEGRRESGEGRRESGDGGQRGSDGNVREQVAEMVERAGAAFGAAMDDDFNTAAALAALFDLARESNSLLAGGDARGPELALLDETFRTLGGQVLGIVPERLTQEGGSGLQEELIQLLIDLRNDFRRGKQWAQADVVRDRLAALGVKLEDKPEGTGYRIEGGGGSTPG